MLNEFNFLFNNENINISFDANGVAWFRAYEIARLLGYADVHIMVRSLNDNEKLTGQVYLSGQNRNIYFINEYGLYRIIMRASSKKPNVVDFQNKVFYDILPCIRKYGAYIDPNTRQQLDVNPNLIHTLNANIDNHEKKRMYHLIYPDSTEYRLREENKKLIADNRDLRRDLCNLEEDYGMLEDDNYSLNKRIMNLQDELNQYENPAIFDLVN